MKKKLTFACVLACAMGVLSLAACNGGEKYDLALKVWAAEAAKSLTQQQADAWAANIKETDGKSVKVTVLAVGEGDAASNMITDVDAGADVFCFAQDQLARLKSAGALTTITAGAVKDAILNNNDAVSIQASKLGDDLVAYPLTSDNGYIMYYDKAVFTDETKLGNISDIIEVCKAQNKKIYFNNTSAWYNASYFFGFGCKSEWTVNNLGHFTSYDDTYNSKNGIKAMKALYEIVGTNKDLVVDDADASHAFSKGADGKIQGAVCISGSWDTSNVKVALGANMGAVELPSATVDGETHHLGSFMGCKLMGVKNQTDPTKLAYAQSLAQYLTGEECQLQRYQTLGWGPSNLNAQKNDEVKNDIVLNALAAQSEYATMQGQYPGDWWTTAGNLSETLSATDGSEAAIKNLLKTYEATISTYLDGLND